ncbi:hypothetical protein SI65_10120 [Aspergillus cristatus]|uniref:F-box domain-containing protein n=1 Tax=Aspergillus cristatus TaxID=573508 RepID=A0A1E3B0P4_ASPCR|nr:hypothetical protein SI65_10120 [Aspergillus cristatus]
MRFVNLPSEVLLHITDFLEYSWNVSALSQTNRYLYTALNHYMYQHNVRHFDSSLFAWAMENGSEIVARKMLDAGASPTKECTWDHFDLINAAAAEGHTEIVRLFLERDLLPVDRRRNLLTTAAIFGSDFVVHLLLDHGVSITSNTAKELLCERQACGLGVTKILVDKLWDEYPRDETIDVLSWELEQRVEAGSGCLETIQYLLQLGISPNTTRPDKPGPLSLAAERGHLDIVRCLVDSGADTGRALETSRRNPIYKAINGKHIDVARFLFQRSGLDALTPKTEGEAALLLWVAAALGSELHFWRAVQFELPREERLLYLMYHHYDLPAPLEVAARMGHETIVGLLLNFLQFNGGKYINMRQREHALFAAIREGHEPIFRLLLDHDADPNVMDSSNSTPLSVAIEHEAIFRLLLERWADAIRTPVSENENFFAVNITAVLVRLGKTTFIDHVLSSLEDPQTHVLLPLDNVHILNRALIGGPAMLKYLVSNGLLQLPFDEHDRQCAVNYTLVNYLPGSLNFLLGAGFTLPLGVARDALNLAPSNDKSALETIDVLLKHGVDINSRSLDGSTVLGYWLQKPVRDAKFIVSRGADPLLVDRDEILLATAVRALSVQDLKPVLQSIDVRSVPRDELRQKIARSLSVAEEDQKWDHVKVLERFQVENNLLAS